MDRKSIRNLNFLIFCVIILLNLLNLILFNNNPAVWGGYIAKLLMFSVAISFGVLLIPKRFNEINKYSVTLMLIFPLIFSFIFLYKSYQLNREYNVFKKNMEYSTKTKQINYKLPYNKIEDSELEVLKKSNEIFLEFNRVFGARINLISENYSQTFLTLDEILIPSNLGTVEGRQQIKEVLHKFETIIQERNNLLNERISYLKTKISSIKSEAFISGFYDSLNKQIFITENIKVAEQSYINSINSLLIFLDTNQHNLNYNGYEIILNSPEDNLMLHQLINKILEDRKNIIYWHDESLKLTEDMKNKI